MPKTAPADLSPSDRVRYQLLLLGMTQRELADALQVHTRTVSRWVSGSWMVPRVVDLAIKYLILCRGASPTPLARTRKGRYQGVRQGGHHSRTPTRTVRTADTLHSTN